MNNIGASRRCLKNPFTFIKKYVTSMRTKQEITSRSASKRLLATIKLMRKGWRKSSFSSRVIKDY